MNDVQTVPDNDSFPFLIFCFRLIKTAAVCIIRVLGFSIRRQNAAQVPFRFPALFLCAVLKVRL